LFNHFVIASDECCELFFTNFSSALVLREYGVEGFDSPALGQEFLRFFCCGSCARLKKCDCNISGVHSIMLCQRLKLMRVEMENAAIWG